MGCGRLRSSGVLGQPVTDGFGFRVPGIEFKQALVVESGAGWLAQLLGVEVGEGQAGAGVQRVAGQEAFEFLGGVEVEAALAEGQGEVVSGVAGVGVEGQGVFGCVEGVADAAGVEGGEGKVVIGFEEGGVGLDGRLVGLEGVHEATVALGFQAASEPCIGGVEIAGGRGLGAAISVTRVIGRRRLGLGGQGSRPGDGCGLDCGRRAGCWGWGSAGGIGGWGRGGNRR